MENKRRVPSVDRGQCNLCESCIEVCPSVFSLNEQTGWIEVAEIPSYPEDDVEQAIILCPKKCIKWLEG